MFFERSASDLSPLSPSERLAWFKEQLTTIEEKLHQRHLSGERGIHHAQARSEMCDDLLTLIYHLACEDHGRPDSLAVVANGGYGRQHMNPGSDIDVLFLTREPGQKISERTGEVIKFVQMLIWDLGYKFLPSTRSISESIKEARLEPQSRTALLDARLIIGDSSLFQSFTQRFRQECIENDQEAFFRERSEEINSRHAKYSHTVFLQEPNVKNSPGGLRDHHNLEWIMDAEAGTRSMTTLVERKTLTKMARRELKDAFDFLHRVRNALQYHERGTDILTLRFQGILADEFDYPQASILRRIEAFMRDYYRHTRHIRNHTKSVFEIFQLQREDDRNKRSFFGFLRKIPDSGERELTDYFIRKDRLYAKSRDLFSERPDRMIRLFLYCQRHDARPSPPLRKLIKEHWHLIDDDFRYSPDNRDSFREILSHKGQAARILRLMHRCGVLGRYLPEFGALDCLVQHEFFHRYTADEHTLRCIDQLDALLGDDDPRLSLYQEIFLKAEDPYALYLALILHDTGRAENVREHIDGSAVLAAELCKRLQVKGGRRSLIMFLVDHHLTLWRFATKKNIDDPEVVAEFAGLMQTLHNLDALLLFTYADSNGTNEEAWSPWKETLILQLYRNTKNYLRRDKAGNLRVEERTNAIKNEIRADLEPELQEIFDEHFAKMPRRYFRYRGQRSIRTHIAAVTEYQEKRSSNPESPFECAVRWIEHPKFGYTEMVLATHEQARLLEKICCVLASHQLNIIASDIYTREDGLVLDLFRVCTQDLTALSDCGVQESVVSGLYQIFAQEKYDPSTHLQKRTNFLHPEKEQVVHFPVRAMVRNDLDPRMSVLEVQALDRIGLLHDIFRCLHDQDLQIIHARICTEKGAALDNIYFLTEAGTQLQDPKQIATLEQDLLALISTGFKAE